MTDIRPGMSVHLVKMPEPHADRQGEMTMDRLGVRLGDIGMITGSIADEDGPLWVVRFIVGGLDRFFALTRENIEPTSPNGVTIDRPSIREDGLFWVKEELEGWMPARWGEYFNEHKWFYPGSDIPYDDADFDEIGPRIERPEGLR